MNRDININYIHNVTQEEYQDAIEYLLYNTIPERKSPASVQRLKRRWSDAEVRNLGDEYRIFFGDKEVIPMTEIYDTLVTLYDDPATGGNFGRDKFYARVKSLYVGISRNDVENFVQNDLTHQLLKRVTKKMKVVRPLPISDGPQVRWQMDLIEFPTDLKHDNLGYQYALTVIDTFSKLSWVRSLKSKEAGEVTAALSHILEQEGPPSVLHSDNGGEFRNHFMSTLTERYGIKQVFGAPYRPQSQGCIERYFFL